MADDSSNILLTKYGEASLFLDLGEILINEMRTGKTVYQIPCIELYNAAVELVNGGYLLPDAVEFEIESEQVAARTEVARVTTGTAGMAEPVYLRREAIRYNGLKYYSGAYRHDAVETDVIDIVVTNSSEETVLSERM